MNVSYSNLSMNASPYNKKICCYQAQISDKNGVKVKFLKFFSSYLAIYEHTNIVVSLCQNTKG